MPAELSKDVVALLQYLLPGFLVAWVYYGLTSHQKPSQFERVVQALIFTLVVRVFVFAEKGMLQFLGQWKSIRPWDAEADLICSLVSAVILGFAAAFVINTDRFHRLLRDRGISKRSAHPSEWYGTLLKYPRYVVLHLKDERRLYGWPEIWPSDPDKGHFYVTFPSWIVESDEQNFADEVEGVLVNVTVTENSLDQVQGMLVNVTDVKWVEFVSEPEID